MIYVLIAIKSWQILEGPLFDFLDGKLLGHTLRMNEKQRLKYDAEREEAGVDAPGYRIKKPVTWVVGLQYVTMVIISWVVSSILCMVCKVAETVSRRPHAGWALYVMALWIVEKGNVTLTPSAAVLYLLDVAYCTSRRCMNACDCFSSVPCSRGVALVARLPRDLAAKRSRTGSAATRYECENSQASQDL